MGACRGSGSGFSAGQGAGAVLVVNGDKASMTQAQLDALLALGAKRWTNYGKDRLYLRDALDGILGITATFYGSGNVSAAERNGEPMSNSEYKRIHGRLADAYIDMATGGIRGVLSGEYSDELVKVIDEKYRKRKT